MKPRIIRQGHCLHLVVDDDISEFVAMLAAFVEADAIVTREGVTSKDVDKAYDDFATAEAAWCRARGFKHDRTLMMALARLIENLHRAEARHATA